MRAIAEAMGAKEGTASGLVKDSRELAKSFDPDRRARGVSPRSGPLAPLAAWLADPSASPEEGRRIVAVLRSSLDTSSATDDVGEAARKAAAAARTAADHLERLSEVLVRAWEGGIVDARDLRAVTALVAAAGASQVELQRCREGADPWPTESQFHEGAKVALQSLSAQLASLLEVEARHRVRRAACQANTLQRAAHAAVARDLEVEASEVPGHSGDAAEMPLVLRNRSAIDLDLRLNVALPTGAWAVLEPQGRGSRLVSLGPVSVPARTERELALVLYVPTTVKLDAYVVPIEVVPQPRDLAPEQGVGRQ
jgi:hypothetical protein